MCLLVPRKRYKVAFLRSRRHGGPSRLGTVYGIQCFESNTQRTSSICPPASLSAFHVNRSFIPSPLLASEKCCDTPPPHFVHWIIPPLFGMNRDLARYDQSMSRIHNYLEYIYLTQVYFPLVPCYFKSVVGNCRTVAEIHFGWSKPPIHCNYIFLFDDRQTSISFVSFIHPSVDHWTNKCSFPFIASISTACQWQKKYCYLWKRKKVIRAPLPWGNLILSPFKLEAWKFINPIRASFKVHLHSVIICISPLSFWFLNSIFFVNRINFFLCMIFFLSPFGISYLLFNFLFLKISFFSFFLALFDCEFLECDRVILWNSY